MVSRAEAYGWLVAFAVVVALAVPWFLWRTSSVVYGLPVWLWWHVGWMALTAVVFYVFSERAWGVGIEAEASEP
ncbi:DUF3311 domain-containing protein [Halorussus halophilus]|uniref:DUF3311 domain-containing protein n=1 Tax=Halorussus halophilus TaxID=2650975 RepID=UPI0013012605|nr:DUF3311 domain-containing protein [Halorussus halophilus]